MCRPHAASTDMLKHHLLIALRTLRRRPGFAALSVVGLAVGFACCLLIARFVADELGYDRAFEGRGVYRLVSNIQQSGDAEAQHYGAVGWPYGRIVEETVPEVEAAVYLRAVPDLPITHAGEHLYEDIVWAEADFFETFPVALAEGDPATALASPFSVVLSDSLARRLYGEARALGRTLVLNDSLGFTVTGVVARSSPKLHVAFDLLASFGTLQALWGPEVFDGRMDGGWLDVNVVTYLRLRRGANAEAVARKVRDLPAEQAGEQLREWGSTYHLGLQPAEDVYLHAAGYGNDLGPQGYAGRLRLLAAIGAFILLLAAINFVNLATARAGERAKEVGVRKTVGSGRGLLVRQFLAESVLVAALALVVAAVLVAAALGLFNSLVGKAYSLADLAAPPFVLGALGATALVGALAGLHPALVLASFRPAEVLKGSFSTGRRGTALRRGLVVVQFAVSVVLVVATLVVLAQLRHMQRQDLGFAGDQVLVVNAWRSPGQERALQTDALKQALGTHAGVRSVSATYAVPGGDGWPGQIAFPEGWPEGESLVVEYFPVDADYVRTLGLELVAGRDFDAALQTDDDEALLINEAAARAAGRTPQEAVGKRFPSPGSSKPEGVVVGVVKDYHHHGLQEAIRPAMYGINPASLGLFALRFDPAQTAAVRAHAEAVWERFFPGYAFRAEFLDEAFAAQYEAERRLARTFAVFAGLAVFVACLGLFGLAAYVTAQRTKEVGVRKVLGASVASLVALLSKDFVVLVLVSFGVAVPVAWLLMQRWLDGFAYPAALGAGPFVLAGLLALAVALVAVGVHALRAATADPVQSLRYE